MDDLLFGTRDKRGNWAPNHPAEPVPIWHRPFSLKKVLAWIPEFLWPWNAFHLATAIIWVTFLIPSWESLATLSLINFLWLYGLNAAGMFLFLGFFEFFYYFKRKQKTLQIQREVSCRPSLGRVLFQKPEHRQLPAVLLYDDPTLDGGRSRDAVGLCEFMGYLAILDDTLALAVHRHAARADRT